MTNVTLERTAPTQNAPATYMPQAQGQAADRRIKEKAPADAPAKMGVRNLDLYYKDFHALKSIDLQFPENQVTALIGPSGCGKSTLLKSLNRMNDLVEGCRIEGEITLDGEDAYRSIDVNNLRRRVGMVFQQPNPFPMSVYDNVAFGPRTHGIKKREDLDAIVEQSLRDAAIWDEMKDRLKKNALGFSGGQQQRLCIARALAVRPEVLLMDEATSAQEQVHGDHGDAQHAAGAARVRQDRVLPAGRDGGGRLHRRHLHEPGRPPHRRLRGGKVRLGRSVVILSAAPKSRPVILSGGGKAAFPQDDKGASFRLYANLTLPQARGFSSCFTIGSTAAKARCRPKGPTHDLLR